jgi:hypothetical protein
MLILRTSRRGGSKKFAKKVPNLASLRDASY